MLVNIQQHMTLFCTYNLGPGIISPKQALTACGGTLSLYYRVGRQLTICVYSQ